MELSHQTEIKRKNCFENVRDQRDRSLFYVVTESTTKR